MYSKREHLRQDLCGKALKANVSQIVNILSLYIHSYNQFAKWPLDSRVSVAITKEGMSLSKTQLLMKIGSRNKHTLKSTVRVS